MPPCGGVVAGDAPVARRPPGLDLQPPRADRIERGRRSSELGFSPVGAIQVVLIWR
jgi:hypothetical protein